MTESEVIVALRNATPQEKEAVYAILQKVEPRKDVPVTTQLLYEAISEVLGTKVGFYTRHAAQLKARIFLTAVYTGAGYTHKQTADFLGIDYQRITYYHRAFNTWVKLPRTYASELGQFDQFLDIVTKKHIL